MSVKERRSKEKIARHKLILDAAMKLIQPSGMQGFTMRKLADQIEYSPCVVYEAFPNKEALILELFAQVCKKLLLAMRRVPCTSNPESYFRKLIETDVKFMLEEPYRVELFIFVSMEIAPEHFPSAMQEVIQLIRTSLENLDYPNLSNEEGVNQALEVLRTFLGGLLKLSISQKSKEGFARCEHILKNGLETLLKGWKNEE